MADDDDRIVSSARRLDDRDDFPGSYQSDIILTSTVP